MGQCRKGRAACGVAGLDGGAGGVRWRSTNSGGPVGSIVGPGIDGGDDRSFRHGTLGQLGSASRTVDSNNV